MTFGLSSVVAQPEVSPNQNHQPQKHRHSEGRFKPAPHKQYTISNRRPLPVRAPTTKACGDGSQAGFASLHSALGNDMGRDASLPQKTSMVGQTKFYKRFLIISDFKEKGLF